MAEQGDDWLAMFGVGYDLWRERQLMARDTVGMSPQRFGLSMMAVLPPCLDLDLEPDLCVCGLPVWIPDDMAGKTGAARECRCILRPGDSQ